MSHRVSIRAQRILACLLTAIGLVYAGVSLYGVLHRSAIGLETDQSGKVLRVAPNGAAARAGIVAGDHVDFARADDAARYYLTSNDLEPEGTVVTLAIGHNGVSHVYRLVAGPQSGDPISPWKRPISALLTITAGVLVFLRPQRATWTFLGYALVSTVTLDNLYLPYPWVIGATDVQVFTKNVPASLLVLFAIWFLSAGPRRWHIPLTVAVLVYAVASGVQFAFYNASASTSVAFGSESELLDILVSLVTIGVLFETFWRGRPENRQRVAWVIAAFTFAIIFELVVPDFVDLSRSASPSPAFFIAYTAWSISPLVVAAAILYTLTRYRVVDLRIAISRAVVYSVTTFVIVLVFALVEWAAAKLFEGSNVTTYAAIVAVLLIGFASNSLHRHVDNVIDAVFFAKLKAAERRLRHLAASLLHTDSEETVVKFLIDEPARALELISAALFIESRDGEGYTRVASVGWNADQTTVIARTDEIVPQMRAAEGALAASTLTWTDERLPHGVEAPLVAIPLKARGDLFGIALYGGHTDGALLNDDECAMLDHLAQNAAAAYDHIEATRTRKEIERLQSDFAQLQARLQPE